MLPLAALVLLLVAMMYLAKPFDDNTCWDHVSPVAFILVASFRSHFHCEGCPSVGTLQRKPGTTDELMLPCARLKHDSDRREPT